jgi:hypothetical protein
VEPIECTINDEERERATVVIRALTDLTEGFTIEFMRMWENRSDVKLGHLDDIGDCRLDDKIIAPAFLSGMQMFLESYKKSSWRHGVDPSVLGNVLVDGFEFSFEDQDFDETVSELMRDEMKN